MPKGLTVLTAKKQVIERRRKQEQQKVSEAFESVRGLVVQTAVQFAKSHNAPLDDIISEAHEAFMEAYRTYKPHKSKFTTHVRHTVWFRLTDRAVRIAERQHRKWNKIDNRWETTSRRVHADLDYTESRRNRYDWLIDLMEGLSADACHVVWIIVQSPAEIADAMTITKTHRRRRNNPESIKDAVKYHLHENLGWRWDRIRKSFSEIRGALCPVPDDERSAM